MPKVCLFPLEHISVGVRTYHVQSSGRAWLWNRRGCPWPTSVGVAAQHLHATVADFKVVAEKRIGLLLRLNKCLWIDVRRASQTAHDVQSDLPDLSCRAKVPPGVVLKVLGAGIHPQVDLQRELEQSPTVAWRSIHVKRVLANAGAKLCILHLGAFLAMTRTSGTRHCTAAELRCAKDVHIQPAQRSATCRSKHIEVWGMFSGRDERRHGWPIQMREAQLQGLVGIFSAKAPHHVETLAH